jgi:hypothetical protein
MSERAGSIPPMTSTTTSARVTSSSASVVNSPGSRPRSLRSRPGPPHRDAGDLERAPDARREIVAVLGEQASHG